METITIHRAKIQVAQLIDRACRGEEIVIARGSTPAVRLVPIAHQCGSREPGSLRGKLRVGAEFFEPLPPDLVEGW